MKNSMHLAAAVLNVSALVQISYILNFDWIHRYNDKVATLESELFHTTAAYLIIVNVLNNSKFI